MPLFWKPYQSDVTQFIDELKAGSRRSKPSSAPAARCCGTARSTARPRPSGSDADVPQQPYVYQTKTK